MNGQSRTIPGQVVNGIQRNYESFLFHAHRIRSSCAVHIPTVLGLKPEGESIFVNANSEHYDEWLAQVSAWADLREPPQQEGLVLIESWHGHQGWYQQEQARPRGECKPLEPALSQRWGTPIPCNPAVLVHGYHLDLIPELLQHLNGGEQPGIDLYMSTPKEQAGEAAALLKTMGWQRAEVVGVENRGRDIGPFIHELLPRAINNGHPWILKLHTKRSAHISDGQEWRQHLLSQLATPEACQEFTQLFSDHPELGLIAPSGTLLPTTMILAKNKAKLEQILQQLRLDQAWWLEQLFVAGSMFAARTASLARLAQNVSVLNHYDSECGQLDGTQSHAIERIIATMAIQEGYSIHERIEDHNAVPNFGYSHAAP